MKLSILVTFYNLVEYVDQALQSIFDQTMDFDYEVLIGDDGSTDDTLGKIQEWKKKHPEISYFVMPRNSSKRYHSISRASKNRINLVNHAKGEYITFLDGDDFYIHKNKLQLQVDILDDPANSDCCICAHNVNYYYQWNGRVKPMNPAMKEQKIKAEEYWSGMYFHPSGLLFRNVFKGAFPDDMNRNYFDDNIITFYALRYGNIYYLPRIMANYRQTHNSLWNTKSLIEQNLLNLIDYDIELQINPRMRMASFLRHYANIEYLYRNRHKLNKKDYGKYYILGKRDGAKEALRWLNYKEGNCLTKAYNTVIFYYYIIKYNFIRTRL